MMKKVDQYERFLSARMRALFEAAGIAPGQAAIIRNLGPKTWSIEAIPPGVAGVYVPLVPVSLSNGDRWRPKRGARALKGK